MVIITTTTITTKQQPPQQLLLITVILIIKKPNIVQNNAATTNTSIKRDADVYNDFDGILYDDNPTSSNTNIYDEDGIRKPDSVKRQRLLNTSQNQYQSTRPKAKSVFAFESGILLLYY